MITEFQVYLIMQADIVVIVVTTLAIIFSLASVILAAASCDDTPYRSGTKKWARRIAPVAVILILLMTFLPDTKTMAAMYALPKILSNDNVEMVSQDAREIMDIAKQGLRKSLLEDDDDDKEVEEETEEE